MKNQKIFSIIIATYNSGKKIEKTLQSIFLNNEDLFELIVIDGASTDDTLEYIKKHKERLTLISEPDEGVYYAFNKAIDLASGDYLYFIGAGDCLKPKILEEVKNYLPSKKTSFVYGRCYFVKQNILNGKKFTDTLFVRDNLCQQGIFYHREIFKILGKFDLRYKVFADWFFNLKCFMSGEIEKIYIEPVIADYEEGGLSAGLSRDPVFLQDFPLFVRQNFGAVRYHMCRAFLKNPLVFNCIYYAEIRLLMNHIINHSSLFEKLKPVLRPFVKSYRKLKKSSDSKS